MSTPDTTSPTTTTVDDDGIERWRGVAAEHTDELTETESGLLQARSRRLLADLIRPHRRLIKYLLLVVVLANVARLSIPYLVKEGIDRGIPPIQASGDTTTLFAIVAIVLLATTVQAVTRRAFLVRSGRIGQDMLYEVRRRVFRHFQRLSPAFHDEYTSGRVISRQTSDMDAIYEMLETGFDGLVTAVLTLVGVAVLLLTLDVKLALVALVCFPFLLALTNWFRKESAKTYRVTREKVALVIVQFVESMLGIRAVQAFRREPRNQEIFDDVNEQYRAANLKAFRLVAWFQSASAALEKLSGVLEERPSVPEPTTPTALAHVRGDVRFERVRFEYVEGVPVLPDLDLDVPAGQTLALVGTTGAGKTTIAKLLSRFYDPTDGRVTLDGVDLRELDETTLRKAVVMVTQENYMFGGTVADNIRFGRPEATDDQVVAAAQAIGAHDFITRLPQGYDTDVANKGGRLSAGQRQLVAFARAFLADPDVLILDEATSSLDVPSERLVQRALRTILADRTAVIIAHRLSTVEIADRVLVLEHGRVVEDGSPQDLVEGGADGRGGRYSDLHDAWLESLA
jgi:ATP-binding cassette subfamily B protein